MMSFKLLAPSVLAGVATLLAAGCSGNTTGDSSGTGGAQGGSAQAGATSQGGKSGSGSGGSSTPPGGAAGSASSGCGLGCIELCQGGVCDCHCEPTCADFGRPAFDKSCATDEDCFAGVHTEDCCGSKAVLGYNASEQTRFDAYEADCTARALCRCAADEPRLEGGQATSDLEQRRAVCADGQCLGTGPVNIGGM